MRFLFAAVSSSLIGQQPSLTQKASNDCSQFEQQRARHPRDMKRMHGESIGVRENEKMALADL